MAQAYLGNHRMVKVNSSGFGVDRVEKDLSIQNLVADIFERNSLRQKAKELKMLWRLERSSRETKYNELNFNRL